MRFSLHRNRTTPFRRIKSDADFAIVLRANSEETLQTDYDTEDEHAGLEETTPKLSVRSCPSSFSVPPSRRVSWADEACGGELSTTRVVHRPEAPPLIACKVLLMHPSECRAEVVLVEFVADEVLQVEHALQQLPQCAKSSLFRALTYTALYCCTGVEVEANRALQDYVVKSGEILIAAPATTRVVEEDALTRAHRLLGTKSFVRQMRRSGQGKRYGLSSSHVWQVLQNVRGLRESRIARAEYGQNSPLLCLDEAMDAYQAELGEGPVCLDEAVDVYQAQMVKGPVCVDDYVDDDNGDKEGTVTSKTSEGSCRSDVTDEAMEDPEEV